MGKLISVIALVATVLLFTVAARAACGPADPTGYYRGTAQSKEAGKLDVTVNLRCAIGTYSGEVTTPVGTFAITGGYYVNGQLHLTFSGGAIGDVGTIDVTFSGATAVGTFRLAADSGSFTILRVENAHLPISNAPVLTLSAALWIEDLHFETTTLEAQHPNPFEFTPRVTFESAESALERQIPSLDGDSVYIGMDHLANMLGDGHTYVKFPPDAGLMPLDIERFGNQYRVVEVARGYEPLLGRRLIAISNVPVGEVHDRFYRQITPVGETSALRDARATNFLTIGMALHGIGVTERRDVARYTFVDGGAQRTVALQALAPSRIDEPWTRIGGRPLYRQRPGNDFWFTYIPRYKAVYCSFRGYKDLGNNAERLLAFVRINQPSKLIIDLRLNGGGDYKEGLKYIIDPIREMPPINRLGHLFVLIGVDTFSAAMANAAQFRIATHSMLVGQPIGERPNGYQEPNERLLPNSHLTLRYSTQYYEFLPGGINQVVPDKQIAATWADVKHGRDPVLDWVLRSPI